MSSTSHPLWVLAAASALTACGSGAGATAPIGSGGAAPAPPVVSAPSGEAPGSPGPPADSGAADEAAAGGGPALGPLEPGAEPSPDGDPESAADAGAPVAASPQPLTVYLVGDSIVQEYPDTPSERDQAGWGQMLSEYFDPEVVVVNRAIGGRTARRFIDEGRLDDVTAQLEPGGVLLIQFGTNDGNRTATYTLGGEVIPYFLDPQTDFKGYLSRYIEVARARGVTPVLVTPTPRNSAYCTGGNGTGGHAAAMRELGAAEAVAVVDLNARTVDYLRAICPAPQPEDFFLLRADGSVDGTHFQENGARILAGFVAEALGASVEALGGRER